MNGKRKTKTCCVCGKTFTGYGNNAVPVADGMCCDECNRAKVIPARIAAWKSGDGLSGKTTGEFA